MTIDYSFNQLDSDFQREFKPRRIVAATFPPCVMPMAHKVPEDRSDFTRDDEATGV